MPTAISTPPSPISFSDATRARLYLKPFTPQLLKTYIPASTLALVTNISYHTLETFPERSFGYIELPAMDAQKLKSKLNGSIIKGQKVKVNEAKPEKRKALQVTTQEEAPADDTDRPKKRRMREQRMEGVLPGLELPAQRKVKRGWTEPASKEKTRLERSTDKEHRKQEVSKYSKEPELLFRTRLPPNKVAITKQTVQTSKNKGKRPAKAERGITVHEFSRTTKHASFLRVNGDSDPKRAVQYVDGQGWVDGTGNVVEAEKLKQKGSSSRQHPDASPTRLGNGNGNGDGKEGALGSSKDGARIEQSDSDGDDSDSSLISSSSAVSSTSEESDASDAPLELAQDSTHSALASSHDPSPPTKAATPNDVHPLEALFKKPRLALSSASNVAKLAPIQTSFSFFNADENDADKNGEADLGIKEPTTPFTKQDMNWRGTRSAAPTPDTAAIGKRFLPPWKDEDEDEDEDQDEDEDEDKDVDMKIDDGVGGGNRIDANPIPPGTKEREPRAGDGEIEGESEFAKWFWEHRGETNRAWKQRRREALKAKRQRENRKSNRRIV